MTIEEERFWSHVRRAGADTCWEWTGWRTAKGYGFASGYTRAVYGSRRAHRVAWTVTHGPVPQGLNVLHRCDNPPCCNPAHLFIGTNADNNADRIRKGRPGGRNWRIRAERQRPQKLNGETSR